MSKAILVIDIDEKIHNSNVTSISFENMETIFFMKDVKLKPLPQKNKYDVHKYATVDYEDDITLGHFLNFGWNDCIDEILGGEKE